MKIMPSLGLRATNLQSKITFKNKANNKERLTCVSWYSDGTKYEEYSTGKKITYYSNGNKSSERLPNGAYFEWYEDGEKKLEKYPDGTYKRYEQTTKVPSWSFKYDTDAIKLMNEFEKQKITFNTRKTEL